jgi:hypothetical protein
MNKQRGIAMVIVLAAVSVALVLATLLLRTSVQQGPETRAQLDRAQAELLCLSVIELAKLKIKMFPTDLYKAFHYMHNVSAAEKTTELYDAFLADLNIDKSDYRVEADSLPWTAKVTEIERLGITKAPDGLGAGYVQDFYRITVEANIKTVGYGFEQLETKLQLQTTLAIEKKEL